MFVLFIVKYYCILALFNHFVERITMNESKTLLVISMSESDNHPAIFLPQVRMETILVLVRLALSRRFKKCRRALPLCTPLLQAIDGVMSLILCPLLCSNTHLSLLMVAMPVSVSAGLTQVKS